MSLGFLIGALGGSFGVAAARATGVVLGLLTSVLLARGLGETTRGELAVVVAWSGLVTQVGMLGSPSSLAYFVARFPEHAAGLLRRSLRVCVAATLVVLVMMAVLSTLGIGNLLSTIGWSGIAVVAFVGAASVALLLTQSVALGLSRIPIFAWGDVAARLISGALIVVVIALGLRSALMSATAIGVGSLVVAIWIRRSIVSGHHASNPRLPVAVTEEIRYGLKAWFACVLFSLITRIAVLALAAARDEATVANFAVALGVADAASVITSAVAQSRFAHMVRSECSGGSALREMRRSISVVGVIAAASATAAFALAPVVMPLVYGAEFSASAEVLRILAVWIFVIPLASVFQLMLAARGMPWLAVAAPATATVAVIGAAASGWMQDANDAAFVVSTAGLVFLASAALAWWCHPAKLVEAAATASQAAEDSDPLPPENTYGSRSRIRWVRNQINAGMKVAEFGCGTGLMLTAPLHRLGIAITGWDVHEPSIAFGREWLATRGIDPSILRCDSFDAAPNGGFDVVIASEVLEHLADADLRQCLGTIREKLRAHGCLLVTIPNGRGWFEFDQRAYSGFVAPLDRRLGLFRVFNGLKQVLFGDRIVPRFPSTMADDVSPHVQWFSRATITLHLEKAGFVVESFEGSTVVAGPIADLFVTGVPPLMWLNNRIGRHASGAASGFRIVARKR
jgi:O-antigen/teichoic acid export membrane protein